MKYTITGSLGNISKPLAETLIRAGHDITIISSDPERKAAIEALGAKAAIGSIADADFLINSFKGADAVYTMVPPNYGATDYRKHIAGMGSQYVKAITHAGVQRVVNLSSMGAHLDGGTGPISGLYDVEHLYSSLEQVAVKHLRPAFFYSNFFHDIPMIKNSNIIGNNFGKEIRMVMVHPRDIAAVAAQELQKPFTGKSYQYVASDEGILSDIATALGTAVGKPELPWVQFSDEDAYAGMTKGGLPPAIATSYVEMGTALRSGKLYEDYFNSKPAELGHTKLADFVKEFALVYNNS